jgi:hypothetical protein
MVNEESTNGFTWSYAKATNEERNEFRYRTPEGEQCLFKYQEDPAGFLVSDTEEGQCDFIKDEGWTFAALTVEVEGT